MGSSRHGVLAGGAAVALLAALLASTASAAGAAPRGTGRQEPGQPKVSVAVVATKLDGPKHITVAPDGQVFVALSGKGGSHCVSGPSVSGKGTTKYCEGLSGEVARLGSKGLQAVRSRLASVIEKDTGEAAGPAAVAFSANGRSLALVYQDELVLKSGRNALAGRAHFVFGTLVIYHGNKRVRSVDLAAFDAAHPQNPKTMGGVPGEVPWDSDPYDVVAYLNGWAVADAAANSLLYVSPTGRVSLLARFPTEKETVPAGVLGPKSVTIHAQAVPTAVAVGPDGALYVGILRGIPSKPRTAQIYRVVPGHKPTVWARGLTAVTAIAFDGGRLLATELSTGGLLAAPKVPGALVEVGGGGAKVVTLAVPGLIEPTGLAIVDGTVYVANDGAAAGVGEILEISGLFGKNAPV